MRSCARAREVYRQLAGGTLPLCTWPLEMCCLSFGCLDGQHATAMDRLGLDPDWAERCKKLQMCPAHRWQTSSLALCSPRANESCPSEVHQPLWAGGWRHVLHSPGYAGMPKAKVLALALDLTRFPGMCTAVQLLPFLSIHLPKRKDQENTSHNQCQAAGL